jgi:hypothetical protein
VPRNAPFTVKVQVDNTPDATTGVAPLRVHWDASKLHLNDINAGELLFRDGVAVTADKHIADEPAGSTTGEASLTLTRAPGAAGVSGSGVVATLNFTATGTGTSAVSVSEAELRSAQGLPFPAAATDVLVTVQ